LAAAMLHVIYGSDGFSIAESFRELRKSLDDDGSLETNTVTFSASDVSQQEVIAACNTVPFLAARRMVVLEGALKGSGGRRRKSGQPKDAAHNGDQVAGAWGALAEYVTRMPDTTVLVLIDILKDREVSDGPLLKALRDVKQAQIQKLDRPDQKAAAGWVQKRANSAGIKLAGGAAKALAEIVGNDTWALASELAKLDAYAGGRPITPEDVLEMVAPARELPPWELLDPIADGKGATALRALRRMVSQKHPLAIAAVIQGTYRQLAIAREMLDGGASGREIGREIGLRDFPLEKLLDRASRYNLQVILGAYARMVRADSDIKRGVYDEQLSIELLVTDLAVAARSTRPSSR
jgi:DNA polymerase-3 subunit delta